MKTPLIDIRPDHWEIVRGILQKHVPGYEVWAFGSRARWTAKAYSDLDLAIITDKPLPLSVSAALSDDFSESDLPYRVDVVDWATTSESFREIIERDRVVVKEISKDIAGEWRETVLGNVLELKRGYDLPQQRRRPGNVPIVSSSGVTDYHAEAMVKGPGVVTGRYGTIGQVFFIKDQYWPLNTTLYVRDFKGNDPRFISYFLRGVDFLAYSDKAAVPGLNRNHLHQARVIIPSDLSEQRAIAHILGTLDDKIELNRRMNETLEATARALFKDWFVDFGPVRTKMEGREPYLPRSIWNLFPERLVDSELEKIPERWTIDTIADHFEVTKGVSYKGSGFGNGGVPLHNLNSIYEGGGYKYEGIKYYSDEYAERHVVRPGDVIVANTEQGHDRLLIGYAAIVPAFFGDSGIASHHIYRLRLKPDSPLTAAFLCALLNSPQMQDVVSGYANGTTVNMLPIDGVQKPKIVCPPRQLVVIFDSLASQAKLRREKMESESSTLAQLRDALLPKLISGQLRVKDTERFLENTL